ncbi:hypothetical protein [uncultured Fibrobacter sp.]|uniref:hypothetical protein n=1 Tax=uncultured Fibrobacter sp. TaxID=261512 RepID=UPI00262209EB|nr:hypothetical protein [uncultured Fibrobacter sp.]
MKNKMLLSRFGAATLIAAFGLVACGDDSSSGPIVSNEINTSETTPASSETIHSSDSKTTSSESTQPASSGNEQPASSGTVNENSSSAGVQCDALAPECGYTLEELCAMGHTSYCTGSSSSTANSSSSRSKEQCVPMPHLGDAEGIAYQIPICTPEQEGTTQPDCETDDVYVCLDSRWTNIQTETCRHITDVGDTKKPHPCETAFDVAMDCTKNFYMMCAGGIWLNATGCDTTKEKCGFTDYKLCNDFNLREYCKDDWLNEPCQGGDSRALRVYDNENSTSYSNIDYMCVDGRWENRMNYYCSEGRGCGSGGFQHCYESDIIGTACDDKNKDTTWIHKDDCDFMCVNGKYEFMAPPTM